MRRRTPCTQSLAVVVGLEVGVGSQGGARGFEQGVLPPLVADTVDVLAVNAGARRPGDWHEPR